MATISFRTDQLATSHSGELHCAQDAGRFAFGDPTFSSQSDTRTAGSLTTFNDINVTLNGTPLSLVRVTWWFDQQLLKLQQQETGIFIVRVKLMGPNGEAVYHFICVTAGVYFPFRLHFPRISSPVSRIQQFDCWRRIIFDNDADPAERLCVWDEGDISKGGATQLKKDLKLREILEAYQVRAIAKHVGKTAYA